jgi:hypothetical protein
MTPTTNKFKALLGAEAADGWIKFMDAVRAELPFLFEPGRPTKQQISDSEIGRAGHSSWAEYVEKELSWNVSQWRAWMRSYKVVLDNEYLRDIEPTSSAINTMARKSDEFPTTKEAWIQKREMVEADQKDRQEKSLAEARRINDELRAEIELLKAEMTAFNAMACYKKILFRFK